MLVCQCKVHYLKRQRLHSLRAAGLPASVYGRVILQKVLYLGIAVFFATNQVPRGMHAIVRAWSVACSRILWETAAAEARSAAGAPGGAPPSLVRLSTACQDHADGGVRAANVDLFQDHMEGDLCTQVVDGCPTCSFDGGTLTEPEIF